MHKKCKICRFRFEEHCKFIALPCDEAVVGCQVHNHYGDWETKMDRKERRAARILDDIATLKGLDTE